MSSMHNAVRRRNHKERAQPRERAKWGILEKHKDYALRAKSYNEKKARLRLLREKASLRNPDEFSYGMLSSKTDRDGVKIADRRNPVLSNDAVKLLKTQDAGYLRVAAAKIRKECDEAENAWLRDSEAGEDGIRIVGKASKGARSSKKTVFVDDVEDQSQWLPQRPAQQIELPTLPSDADEDDDEARKVRRKARKDAERVEREREREEAVEKKIRKQRESRISGVEALRTRQDEIASAARELEIQRARMGKSLLVGGFNKRGVRFKVKERRKR